MLFLIAISVLILPFFDINLIANNNTPVVATEIIWLLSFFAFRLNLIREIVKDIEDVDGDYNLNDFYGNNFVTMGADPDYGSSAAHAFCITSVGVEENALNGAIGIFPNPTSGVLNIMNNDSELLINSIEVVDALGAIVLIENNVTLGNHTVDLSAVSEGVYCIKLNTTEGVSIRKVIKK